MELEQIAEMYITKDKKMDEPKSYAGLLLMEEKAFSDGTSLKYWM